MTFGKNTDQSEGKDTSSKNLKKNVVILEDNGTDEEDKNLSEIRLQEDTDNEQDVGTIDENDVADTNNTVFNEEYETNKEEVNTPTKLKKVSKMPKVSPKNVDSFTKHAHWSNSTVDDIDESKGKNAKHSRRKRGKHIKKNKKV